MTRNDILFVVAKATDATREIYKTTAAAVPGNARRGVGLGMIGALLGEISSMSETEYDFAARKRSGLRLLEDVKAMLEATTPEDAETALDVMDEARLTNSTQ